MAADDGASERSVLHDGVHGARGLLQCAVPLELAGHERIADHDDAHDRLGVVGGGARRASRVAARERDRLQVGECGTVGHRHDSTRHRGRPLVDDRTERRGRVGPRGQIHVYADAAAPGGHTLRAGRPPVGGSRSATRGSRRLARSENSSAAPNSGLERTRSSPAGISGSGRGTILVLSKYRAGSVSSSEKRGRSRNALSSSAVPPCASSTAANHWPTEYGANELALRMPGAPRYFGSSCREEGLLFERVLRLLLGRQGRDVQVLHTCRITLDEPRCHEHAGQRRRRRVDVREIEVLILERVRELVDEHGPTEHVGLRRARTMIFFFSGRYTPRTPSGLSSVNPERSLGLRVVYPSARRVASSWIICVLVAAPPESSRIAASKSASERKSTGTAESNARPRNFSAATANGATRGSHGRVDAGVGRGRDDRGRRKRVAVCGRRAAPLEHEPQQHPGQHEHAPDQDVERADPAAGRNLGRRCLFRVARSTGSSSVV